MKKKKIKIDKILTTDSKNLAGFIVAHRVLGCWKEEAKACMIELSKRRINGDDFDFESFIAEEVKKNQFKVNIDKVLKTKNSIQGMLSQSILGALAGLGNLGKIDGDAGSNSEEEDDLDFED